MNDELFRISYTVTCVSANYCLVFKILTLHSVQLHWILMFVENTYGKKLLNYNVHRQF